MRYLEYRTYLRHDFFYSCGYCTLSEFEAQGLRFTIDHYEPKSNSPELEHDYDNLIYACDECNTYKGDMCPPQQARESGYRFFRPDQDAFPDHFVPTQYRINHLTKVGEFTIEMLELNRGSLRRLRELRERLHKVDDFVSKGIFFLRRYKIDHLPKEIRGRALRAISNADHLVDKAADDIDRLLRNAAKSPLLDEDLSKQDRRAEKADKLSVWQGLHPGKWRGRGKGRK